MAKVKLYQQMQVNLAEKSYPIIIGQNILADSKLLRQFVFSKQVMIVTNDTVAALYLEVLQKVFADYQCNVVVLEEGESFKNQQNINKIYDALVQEQHHRDTTLIALGGGVIGDMTGFAASTYQRGVRFIQLPTTLLAQVDAAIGGKTAINHPQGKNMIGTFYQPGAVVIDLACLATLPEREYRAGLAEIIKYAILEGGDFFSLVSTALKKGLAIKQSADLPAIISACCRIKASFVQHDEYDQGSRVLLNLGHTLAHALEAQSNYQRWLHGEAVAIGLYFAALLSYHCQLIDKGTLNLIDNLLALAELPRRIPKDFDLTMLSQLMSNDKKNRQNKLHFVLIKDLGDCYLSDEVSNKVFKSVLHYAVEGA